MKTLVASLVLLATAVLNAQTFGLNKANYQANETITATWTAGPGNATDWVAIYPNPLSDGGQPDGNPASTRWNYVNGTKNATAGIPDGSLSFTAPGLATGNWIAYFLANDGYSQIAPPVPFSVGGITIPTFTASHKFIEEGVPVTLSWNVAANGFTISSLTISDGVGAPVDVIGTTSLPVSPEANTIYTLSVNNGAVTKTLHVLKSAAGNAAFSLNSSTIFVGQPVTATWAGATANPDSWIGIYARTNLPESQLSTTWNYLNGTRTEGGSVPDGSMAFTLPAGEYYACLFTDGGYQIEQGPILFSVVPEPNFKITSVVPNGNQVTIAWESRAGYTYDIYASETLEGAPPAGWEEVTFMHPAEGAITDFVETLATPAPRRFYKVYEFAE